MMEVSLSVSKCKSKCNQMGQHQKFQKTYLRLCFFLDKSPLQMILFLFLILILILEVRKKKYRSNGQKFLSKECLCLCLIILDS